jgi:TonB family protein
MLGLEYVTAHPDHVLGYIHMDGLVSVPQMQNAVLDNAAKRFAAATPKDDADLAQAAQLRALPPDNPARLFGALGLAMGPAGLYFAGDQTAGFAAAYQQIGAAVKPYHLPPTALLPASEPGAALIVNDHFLTRDDTPLLAKVTVPTLILSGKQDGVIPPSVAEATHAAVKGSQLVELDNCGHFPFMEQPEKTTAAILSFVSNRKADTTSKSNTPAVIGRFSDLSLPRKQDAKAMHGQTIIARWDVDGQGQVSHITLDPPSGNRDIDRAIIEAVQRFRFRPATQNGLVAPAHLTHTFVIAP